MSEFLVIAIVAFALFGTFGRSRRAAPDLSGWDRAIRDLQRQLEATQAELDQQRLQVAELAERLDFAERRLVQIQSGRTLPPPSTS